MAGFTEQIQGPSNIWMIGRGAEAPNESALGIFGKALSGVAGIADKVGTAIGESNKEAVLGQEDADVSDAVRDYANGVPSASTPPLVGENTSPAASSPTVQAAKGELDKVQTAIQQGSPGAKQAALTRISEITSRYVAQDPRYAAEIREHAQRILGFNVNEALFNEGSYAEDMARKVSDNARVQLIDEATKSGILYMKPDGSLDQDKMLTAGQEIAQEKAKTEASLAQAQVQAAQSATKLTLDQQNDQEFRIAKPYVDQVTNHAADGFFTNMLGVLGNIPKNSPVDNGKLFGMIGVAQAKADAAIDQFASEHNLSFSTIQNLHKYNDDKFASIKSIAGGDLSQAGQLTQTLKTLQEQNKLAFHVAAPHAAAALDVGGPGAAGAIFQTVLAPNAPTPAYTNIEGELNTYFNRQPSLDETLHASVSTMAGKYSIPNEPNPAKARAVLGTVLPVVDKLSETPTKLDDKGYKAFGHVVQNASAAAIQTNNPEDIINAGERLLRPQVVQTMLAYAKNPAAANDAPQTLAYYGQLAQKATIESAKVLTAGADQKLFLPVAPLGAGVVNARVGYPAATTQANTIDVHYSAMTGSDGHVQLQWKATNQGKSYALSDGQKRTLLAQDPGFVRSMNVFNQAADADRQIKTTLGTPETQQAQSEPKNNVFASKLKEIFPDARITSEKRTAAENASIGGAAHSMHLTGQAMDFVPAGKSWSADDLRDFAAKLDAEGLPHTELFIEHKGDAHSTGYHVHWGWGAKA